jgi:hypothetical protein
MGSGRVDDEAAERYPMSHAELMTPENQKPEADKSKRQSALAPAGLLGHW